MKVTYTAHAGRDLLRLRDFIRQKNPQAANKSSRQLQKNIQSLVNQPQMGTAVEGLESFYELVAHDYIIRYRVLPDEIAILNIWHRKEDR